MKNRNIFFLLFTLSGFSGLIYESIWTHYLKLFLGHAAYAQSLVLAIFMGGMAIGSWICSSYSLRWKNLLLGYAVAEGTIGLCAMGFHNAFAGALDLSYSTIIPDIGNPAYVSAFKWTLSGLMILPQSVLLGMTFPLMSAGVLRLFRDRPGRSIAMLYFTNSIGAAIGVLISGFLLIRLVGLPGTIRTAGLINIALAMAVWLLVRKIDVGDFSPEGEKEAPVSYRGSGWYRFLLLASLVTGTASFIYEIGWIRMLSLVLGSSTHAFELMLSAFIFGLAFGGLWIQRRIDRIVSPVRYLAHVQVVMGLLAISTLLLYGNTFNVMQWMVGSLGKTDTGYTYFNLFSNGIALAIMLPATFCAGMTLPLITFILIKAGHGERSIGAVYASNTVGAIVGVFFAIHLGMPLMGLKGLMTFGACLDIVLGIGLLWSILSDYRGYGMPAAITAVGIGAVTASFLFLDLDPYKMGSGVYRLGKILVREDNRLLYHRDGKTATVSLFLDTSGKMSIRTNGKIDAAIVMEKGREAHTDETTMILLAAIPMALAPDAETAASVGMGSGLTSHILLGNPRIKTVDTIEIEKGMIEAANNFRPRVERVYTDPRSHIYVDDAKTFFSTYNKKYDLIVSEPSNPWVSGVAGLFSAEFYRLIGNHLNDNGLFVQWVQLYEINTDLVVSVLKAVSSVFPDYAVYAPNDGDIMIIAGKKGLPSALDPHIFNTPSIADDLRRIHVESLQDIAIRKIGVKEFYSKLLESYPIHANSDYYPVLDQNAARTRFLGSTAEELVHITHVPLPTLEMLSGPVFPWHDTDIAYSPFFSKSLGAFAAMGLRDFFLSGKFDLRYTAVPAGIKQKALRLRKIFHECGDNGDEFERMQSLFDVSVTMIPYLSVDELTAFWKTLESGPCSGTLSAQEKLWVGLFRAVSDRDAVRMVSSARAISETAYNLPLPALRYLAASEILGLLKQGEKTEAFHLWSYYRTVMFGHGEPDLLFRLLAAESAAR